MLIIYLHLLQTLKGFLSDVLRKWASRILRFYKLFFKLSFRSCLTGLLPLAWQDLHSFFPPLSFFRQLQLLKRHLLTLSPPCSNTSSFSSFYKSDNLLAPGCLSSCLLAHRAQRHFTLPAAQLLSSKVLILARFSPFHEISHSSTKLSPPLPAAEAAKS